MLSILPLRDRVFRSKRAGVSVPACGQGRDRPYKFWMQDQMNEAIKAVAVEQLSVRRAALLHNVPKSSLGDRLSGRVLPDATCGPPKYVSLN